MHAIQIINTTQADVLCGVRLRLETPGGRIAVTLKRNDDNSQVLRDAVITAAAVNAAGWTDISWSPVKVEAGTELAIVVTAGDTTTTLGVAQIGLKDPTAGTYVTTPAIEIGTLYTESADGTVRELANTVMALQLLRAAYTETARTDALGAIAVTNATDLAIVAGIDKTDAGAATTFTLTLDDARTFTVDNAQRIQLGGFYTGSVQVAVNLQRGGALAPIVSPGTTVLVGSMSPSADYIGGAFAMGGGNRISVTFEALLPSGSGIAVQYQPATADPEAGPWTDVPYLTNSGATAGFVSITHEVAGVTAPAVRIRLVESGTPTARPQVRNLVAVAL